jgi:hypothetical protein
VPVGKKNCSFERRGIVKPIVALHRRIRLSSLVSVEVVILMTVAAVFLPGGQDLYGWYVPFAGGCVTCGFNPWHASWILWPLSLIPYPVLWPLWTLLTLTVLTVLARRLEVNPVWMLLAFPTMGLVWLGQVDAVVALGLVMALLGRSPTLRGAGVILASIKPQIAGAAILVLLWHDSDRWKTLILPAALLALTFLVWGVDWPLRWLAARPWTGHVWATAAIFPYGLVAFGAIWLVKTPREQAVAALLASAIALPWYSVYSYTVILIFLAPWWVFPLSYVWALAYPWLGNESLRFASSLPIVLLGFLIWPSLREHWCGWRAGSQPDGSPLETSDD